MGMKPVYNSIDDLKRAGYPTSLGDLYNIGKAAEITHPKLVKGMRTSGNIGAVAGAIIGSQMADEHPIIGGAIGAVGIGTISSIAYGIAKGMR